MSALVLWLAIAASAPAAAQTEASPRAAHLTAALEAIRGTKTQVLKQAYGYLAALEGSTCAADLERLRVECLMTAARRYCKTAKIGAKRCPLALDVVVSNVLSERQLISSGQRYELMRRTKDYRQEMYREMRRLHGALTVDFRLVAGPVEDAAALGKAIDAYCLATSDASNLSWQSCAAGLVWFIGTSGGVDP